MAFVLLLMAFLHMGSFEMVREAGLQTVMQEMGGIKGWMPPFAGTTQEREVLALYIMEELGAKR